MDFIKNLLDSGTLHKCCNKNCLELARFQSAAKQVCAAGHTNSLYFWLLPRSRSECQKSIIFSFLGPIRLVLSNSASPSPSFKGRSQFQAEPSRFCILDAFHMIWLFAPVQSELALRTRYSSALHISRKHSISYRAKRRQQIWSHFAPCMCEVWSGWQLCHHVSCQNVTL